MMKDSKAEIKVAKTAEKELPSHPPGHGKKALCAREAKCLGTQQYDLF